MSFEGRVSVQPEPADPPTQTPENNGDALANTDLGLGGFGLEAHRLLVALPVEQAGTAGNGLTVIPEQRSGRQEPLAKRGRISPMLGPRVLPFPPFAGMVVSQDRQAMAALLGSEAPNLGKRCRQI